MKANIHPNYVESTVTCTCGNTFKTHSTAGDISVEICSACHPFYTGKQKLVDTAGRVDRFKAKLEASAARKAQGVEKKERSKASNNSNDISLADIKAELKEELVDSKPESTDKEA